MAKRGDDGSWTITREEFYEEPLRWIIVADKGDRVDVYDADGKWVCTLLQSVLPEDWKREDGKRNPS